MLQTVIGKKWLGLAIALVALVAFACGTREVVKTVEVEVPGETVVVEKEVIKEVPVEVVVEKEVVKEVEVPGETVVVEKEVVREVKVPGETVVVEKEVVKEVPVEVVVEKEVVKEVEVEVVVEKEVVKEVPKEVVVTKEVIKEVPKEIVVTKEVVKEVEVEVVVEKEVIKEVEKIVEVEATVEKHLKMRFKEAIAHINPFDPLSRPHSWSNNLLGSRLIFPDDKNMQWSPDLAERWEVSDDATSYTFYLRKGAMFHDGEEVTADDVVFTFKTYLNPEASPRGPNLLSVIQGAEAYSAANGMGEVGVVKVDNYTVRFDQEFPNALFLDKCCNGTPIIMPEHVLGDVAPAEIANYPWSSEFIGSGPFILDVPSSPTGAGRLGRTLTTSSGAAARQDLVRVHRDPRRHIRRHAARRDPRLDLPDADRGDVPGVRHRPPVQRGWHQGHDHAELHVQQHVRARTGPPRKTRLPDGDRPAGPDRRLLAGQRGHHQHPVPEPAVPRSRVRHPIPVQPSQG